MYNQGKAIIQNKMFVFFHLAGGRGGFLVSTEHAFASIGEGFSLFHCCLHTHTHTHGMLACIWVHFCISNKKKWISTAWQRMKGRHICSYHLCATRNSPPWALWSLSHSPSPLSHTLIVPGKFKGTFWTVSGKREVGWQAGRQAAASSCVVFVKGKVSWLSSKRGC